MDVFFLDFRIKKYVRRVQISPPIVLQFSAHIKEIKRKDHGLTEDGESWPCDHDRGGNLAPLCSEYVQILKITGSLLNKSIHSVKTKMVSRT
jgi:hypothetical protein